MSGVGRAAFYPVFVVVFALAACEQRAPTPTARERGVAPPPAGCDAIVRRFHDARSHASNACTADSDCGCFNGVDPAAQCGGVTDRATATALAAIEGDFHRSACAFGAQCAPWACHPKCVQGACAP